MDIRKGVNCHMCKSMKEFSSIAETLYNLEQKKASKKKEVNALDAKIKALKKETASYMKKRRKSEINVSTYNVRYSPYMKPFFDHKAFIENEEDGQKLYEKYKKETPVELITIKIASV
ncbi:hypothetical protein [Robinsoniella sp. KNHs210]|nr:hypothetical protein [Robinsoniella sp. KNHs210]